MIFISYRRDDSGSITLAICERLSNLFGRSEVLIDVDDLPIGVDFKKEIQKIIDKCLVVLVVIGPAWLKILKDKYESQFTRERDFVYLEMREAIEKGKILIPVLVHGASTPSDAELPEEIRELVSINAPTIGHRSFRRDTDDLQAVIWERVSKLPGINIRKMKREATGRNLDKLVEIRNENRLLREQQERSANELNQKKKEANELAIQLNEIKQQLAGAPQDREKLLKDITEIRHENTLLRTRNASLQAEVAALMEEGRTVASEKLERIAAPAVMADFSRSVDKLGQAAVDAIVPSLGQLGPRFQIIEWLVRVGDKVQLGQLMCRIRAHGKMIGVQCPATGRALKIYLIPNVSSSAPRSVCSIALHVDLLDT